MRFPADFSGWNLYSKGRILLSYENTWINDQSKNYSSSILAISRHVLFSLFFYSNEQEKMFMKKCELNLNNIFKIRHWAKKNGITHEWGFETIQSIRPRARCCYPDKRKRFYSWKITSSRNWFLLNSLKWKY